MLAFFLAKAAFKCPLYECTQLSCLCVHAGLSESLTQKPTRATLRASPPVCWSALNSRSFWGSSCSKLVDGQWKSRVVEVWSLKAKPFFCFGFVVSTFQDGVSCSQGWLRAHYMAKHGLKLMICLFSPPECWGFRGVDDHTLLNSSFCLWVLNAVSLTMSQNHTLEHVIPASRWLSVLDT